MMQFLLAGMNVSLEIFASVTDSTHYLSPPLFLTVLLQKDHLFSKAPYTLRHKMEELL
jgi:hypothetical protein